MKVSAIVWCGVAGLGLFLLLGQLFADYPELKFGVSKLVAIIAIGLLVAAGVNLLILRVNTPKPTKYDILNETAPFAAFGVLILVLMAIGGV